jgi:prevent-host-death family protein
MHYVGVRELKNRLTYYLRLTRQGDNVIVTDRGKPMAILHAVESVEETAGPEERLASLAAKGLVRLPVQHVKASDKQPAKVKGKAVSKMIIEDRR